MLLSILATALIGYGILVAVMYAFQDRMLYFPTEDLVTTPAHRGLLFETVTFSTKDGESLHAWWIPAEGEERGVLLFSHGNAGNISGRLESAAIFNKLGLSVLLFDYRGYGQSTGTPNEEGLYQDGQAAWTYLTQERGVDPLNIVLYGRSLGGGVATWLATRHQCAALIVEATFTSVPDVAAEHYRFLPVRLLARSKFDNLSRISQIQAAALMVIHSPHDEIIPYAHGQRLYEAARGNKTFLEIEGGHNDGFFVTGARYRREIDAFLQKHLGR